MLSALPHRNFTSPPSKNEQTKSEQSSPAELREKGAVLLDVLRTLEQELQKRGFLDSGGESSFNPLWFVAETERNVFLWRRGCSLIQKDEFEFWIDVRALIEKRLSALDRYDPQNPFVNPLWGEPATSLDSVTRERAYLEAFLGKLETLHGHAYALCEVGSRVLRELCGEAAERERVLLPSTKKPR